MYRIVCCCVLPGLLLIASLAKGHNPAECARWSKVAANCTGTQSGLTMTCQSNSSCTGISCSGVYSYRVPSFTGNVREEVDFCFGFRLNPCDSPVTTDVYLQVPNKQQSNVFRRSASDVIQVPKLKYSVVSRLITADVFLDVTMEPVANGKLNFGVDVTVRADYTLSQTWPEGLKKSLVPRQVLNVPTCPKTQPVPALVIPPCHQVVTPKPKPTTTPPPTKPPGSGKPCQPNMLYSCPPNEMCKVNMCVCRSDYRSATGGCEPYHSVNRTTTPQTAGGGVTAASTGSSTQNTTVIASAVVASIVGVILVVAVVIIIVRWRRARAQYANHELLLNNDDNMVM